MCLLSCVQNSGIIAGHRKRGGRSFIFRFILVISDVYFEGNVRKSAVFIGNRRLKTFGMGENTGHGRRCK